MSESSRYKKPSAAELKQKLSPMQYLCTQENGTERPFENQYWDHKHDGIYVDIVTGEPLFCSIHKYDSGSGWPSFTQPIENQSLQLKPDYELGMERTEVRSVIGDSHLGHVFDDGPQETGGQRYCINSSSLQFIPIDELKQKGYGRYLFLFAENMNWETATLAGGCFWGVEELFRLENGVIATHVGYSGGDLQNPKYEDVKTGHTGHAEAIQVLFNPQKINYEQLLSLFFKLHNPTTIHQQGNDIGSQYRSAIFYHTPEQKNIAQAIVHRVEKSNVWERPIVTEIVAFKKFWSAEEYHQEYLLKNPGGYTCHFVRKINF